MNTGADSRFPDQLVVIHMVVNAQSHHGGLGCDIVSAILFCLLENLCLNNKPAIKYW